SRTPDSPPVAGERFQLGIGGARASFPCLAPCRRLTISTSAAPNPVLYLRTFGTCALERADGAPLDLQRRPLALLAFVAAAGTRGTTREKAVGFLWPNADEDRARHSLAQAVYALKRACDADPVEGGAGLRLDEAVVSADLLDFERAIAAGEHEQAAQLYMGAFLDGFHLPNAGEFERWMDGERARLQRLAKRAIEACEHVPARPATIIAQPTGGDVQQRSTRWTRALPSRWSSRLPPPAKRRRPSSRRTCT